VAFGAGDRLVAARQGISASSVIEAGLLEAFDLVAASAVVFELPEMRVFPVAIGALSEGDSAETLSLVTTRAKESFVFPEQGESGGRMVEFRLSPRSLRVASLAIDPQGRSMGILVAVGAGFEGDSAETLSPVATRANESFVFSQQTLLWLPDSEPGEVGRSFEHPPYV
jgi:hypothetical protein